MNTHSSAITQLWDQILILWLALGMLFNFKAWFLLVLGIVDCEFNANEPDILIFINLICFNTAFVDLVGKDG